MKTSDTIHSNKLYPILTNHIWFGNDISHGKMKILYFNIWIMIFYYFDYFHIPFKLKVNFLNQFFQLPIRRKNHSIQYNWSPKYIIRNTFVHFLTWHRIYEHDWVLCAVMEAITRLFKNYYKTSKCTIGWYW